MCHLFGTEPGEKEFKLRLLTEAVRIYVMHFLLEMIEVVAMTNLYCCLLKRLLFRNLIAAISANVTPPKK